MNVDSYLDSLRSSFKHLEDEEREAVLVEVRDYIDQESERLRNLSPGMEKDEAVRLAIQDFGKADDIALIYNKANQVMTMVNQRTGEVLLDMPEMSGKVQGKRFSTGARGIRAIISYRRLSAVAAASLMLMAVAGIWFAGQDVELASAPPPVVLMQYGGNAIDPMTLTESDTFTVPSEWGAATFSFDLQHQAGCMSLAFTNPSGDEVLNTGDICETAQAEWTFPGSGEWTVTAEYTAFVGDVSLDVVTADWQGSTESQPDNID